MAMLLPHRLKNGSIFFNPHFEMDNFVDERQEELHAVYREAPFSHSFYVGRRHNGGDRYAERNRDTRAGGNGRTR
ncbi:hypothetical protein PEC301296_35110 [Pectobacterium carotovorum subsp. carotovorum]|nr:hypothetical protein GZ59_41700 [Pectobacterium atrosepticum]POW28670.1 hypothetical protein PB72LOC_02265 [Pectobacterium atrosepticum]GKV87200.1 hypothetical protein PEC301296_35110 [Pectobacterium carotovorum subsp. carotovorum]